MPARWLNRTVLGASLTSGLADMAYQTASVVLPGRHFIQEEAPVELQAALAVWLETLTQGRR